MDWQLARQQLCAAPFDSLRDPLKRLIDEPHQPDIDRLNACAAGISNFRGKPIRFIANPEAAGAAHYEMRIAETGQIATRQNWHDFFNALSWLAFPQTKSAISEMHARLLLARGENEQRERSTPRDALTLFDEGGIIVTSSDESLLDLIRCFQWKALFVDRRADVMSCMHFYLFGHSMLEKALDPYIGVTAKAILLLVDDAFIAANHATRMREIDQRTAKWLMEEENLASSRNFSPLPWLGVPSWWKENESPDFYDNTQYFRSGRSRGASA